MYMKKHTKN